MKTFVEGQTITITVPFLWDGEPFVPDGGAFTFDLRGQDGSLLITGQAETGVTDTCFNLTVNSSYNQLAQGSEFEKRMMVVYATRNGDPWTHRINYRLCPWLNFTASEDDVRTFIGIGPGELPNREINLVAAYFDCESYMSPQFVPALSSASDLERQANRAIIAQAVILLMPSLQTRISQQEGDGTMSATRFKIDFTDLEARASDQLSRAINLITDRTIVAPPTIVVGRSRDPFKGVRPDRWRW